VIPAKPIVYEFRRLRRQGVSALYAIILLLFVLLVRVFPPDVRSTMLPFVLFSEPVIVGYILSGGIFFMELEQNTHALYQLMPAGVWRYLILRITTFAIYGGIGGAFLTVGAMLGAESSSMLVLHTMAAGILCFVAAPAFTALGVFSAALFSTINGFIIKGVVFLLPMMGTIASVFIPGVARITALGILPGGGFFLFLGGFLPQPMPATPFRYILGAVNIVGWTAVGVSMARNRMGKRLVREGVVE